MLTVTGSEAAAQSCTKPGLFGLLLFTFQRSVWLLESAP